MKPLWRSIRDRIWTQKSTERLDSNEDLSKHDHWYSRWLQTCGKRDLSSSHGANEPVDFDSYVRYTRGWHRRRRPPNAAVQEIRHPVPNAVVEEKRFTLTENKPVLSRVPSVQSLRLPLHGVRKEDNRYSTVDPIQELRGILETKELDRMSDPVRNSHSIRESCFMPNSDYTRYSDPDLEIGRALWQAARYS